MMLKQLLKGAFITTTAARPHYYVKIEFKTLKQAQDLGEYLSQVWREAQKETMRNEPKN